MNKLKAIFPAVVIIFFVVKCDNSSKPDKHKKQVYDTVITAALIDVDPFINNRQVLTVKRVLNDTFKEVVVDSSEDGVTRKKIWTTDTVYAFAWYSWPVPDSTGKKAMRNSAGQDSVIWKWIPIARTVKILQDYNQNYK